jgi:hypothetical protein
MGNVPSGLAKAAPIHEAAASDNVAKLVALLAEGEDVDAVDGVSCCFFFGLACLLGAAPVRQW